MDDTLSTRKFMIDREISSTQIQNLYPKFGGTK